eukprot:gene18601-biopygen23427
MSTTPAEPSVRRHNPCATSRGSAGRNESGRGPDAEHTIEIKETDAGRTRAAPYLLRYPRVRVLKCSVKNFPPQRWRGRAARRQEKKKPTDQSGRSDGFGAVWVAPGAMRCSLVLDKIA